MTVSSDHVVRFLNVSQKPIKPHVFTSYGVTNLGKVAVEVTLQLYLFDFYTRILGLNPMLAGVAFGVAILWDALSDVIVSMGLFTARSKGVAYSTVLGLGAVLLAAATITLFSPIQVESTAYLFVHLLGAYVLVNTGMTLMDLPHSSLSAELTRRASERNKLLASRMGFGILGLAVGSALPGIYLATAHDPTSEIALAESRKVAAWVLAAVVLTTSALTVRGLRKREQAMSQDVSSRLPKWAEVCGIFADKVFMNLLFAGTVAAVGRTINAALALMYYRFVLELSEAQVTQAIFPVFTLSIVLSIPVWVACSNRYGKQGPAYISVGGLGFMGMMAYPILPAGLIWPPLIVSMIAGVLCGAVFLIDSMITDLIDTDEQITGNRKESLYFAVWKSGLKLARAIAFVVIGYGLHLFQLDLSQEMVTEGARTGIVWLFGVAVGLCFIVAAIFIFRARVPDPLEN